MRLSCLSALVLFAFSALAPAQQFKNPNNLGPDMPTPQPVVDGMLQAAQVKAGETVYDLGCGDGRILITAVQKFNAKGVGIEMDRDIYQKTVGRVKSLGMEDRIRIIHGNALHTDLTPADVVTFYFLTGSNDRLKPVLAKLHPGARIVSHDFEVPGWKADHVSTVRTMGTTHTIYLYQVKP